MEEEPSRAQVTPACRRGGVPRGALSPLPPRSFLTGLFALPPHPRWPGGFISRATWEWPPRAGLRVLLRPSLNLAGDACGGSTSDACHRLLWGRWRYGRHTHAHPALRTCPASLTSTQLPNGAWEFLYWGSPAMLGDREHKQSHSPEPSPVHEVEILLQEARVHGALAELQLCLGIVVHVVDTHLL